MSDLLYQRLDRGKREIRLIILKEPERSPGGTHTTDTNLRCELITTSLDVYKEPLRDYAAYAANRLSMALARTFLSSSLYSNDFYALSYVWGDPVAVCDVEVGGTAIRIAANLHAALLSIRDNTKFRAVWADALCINQSDEEEKSWQVRQMAAIYSRARATISWLGRPSENSSLALDALAALGRATSRFFWSIQEAEEGGPPPRAVRRGVAELARDPDRWGAVAELCARPYWTRVWIFQEMACAREKYFLCGSSAARDIDRPISLLLAWQAAHPEASTRPLGPHCLSMVRSVQTFRFHGNFPSDAPYYVRPGTLYEMLVTLSALDTTEPRDKIYAPLAVATDRDQLEIVPSYAKDLEEIWKETACSLLRSGRLEVLVSASLQDARLSQLPSWVPNWSGSFDTGPGRRFRADRGHSQRPSTLEAIPRCSDHITLDGYLVGAITRIHAACPETALESLDIGPADTTFASWLEKIGAATSSSAEEVAGEREGKNRASRAAIAELLSAEPGPRPAWSLSPNPYAGAHKAIASATSLRSLVADLTSEGTMKQDNWLVDCIKRIHCNLSSGSKPFRTDCGAMGLTCKDKEAPGDLVVLIPGASMPCVLRRLDAQEMSARTQTACAFRLVGVTYIHGMMQGEFLKDARELGNFTIF